MSRPPPRLYVETGLDAGAAVRLDGNAAHYLVHVLRLKAGDDALLFNGTDGEWRAEITDVGRRACRLMPSARTRPQAPSAPLTLAFAPLKKAAMGFLVEKATELGVGRLQPVITARTEAARVNLERVTARAREAAEQCGRLSVPAVAAPMVLATFIEGWPAAQPLWMGDESGGGEPLAAALAKAPSGVPHGILIGPEGGFTADELATLARLPFVTRVDLGPRVLRAETAALAALACWQALIGDGRGPGQ